MSSEVISPFQYLWQYNYPFRYWYNRLEKINPYNEQDKLEALYSLIQLTDIYSHIFAANVRNPEMPWFFIKEKTYRGNINDVLDGLRVDGSPMVENILDSDLEVVKIQPNDEYDIDEFDALSVALLGCPYTIDEETNTVEFDEPPEIHRGVSNAILRYAEGTTALLNDFKHGFRVIPLTPDDLITLTETIIEFGKEDREKFDATLENLQEKLSRDTWGFCFSRMQTKKTDYGYECQLDVYHVDAWSCYKFAELTLDALYNLVTPGQGRYLEESLMKIPDLALGDEISLIDHVFGFALPLRDDPNTVLSKEDFHKG